MPNFTEIAIKKSFIKLLGEKPLNHISVKDIVEECGINRNSFYYHFHDIPMLVEQILKDFFDELIKRYPDLTSLDDCFKTAFMYILENKKAVLHIYNSVSRDAFENYLMKFCEYAVNLYFDTAFDNNLNEKDKEIAVRFLKCQLFGAFIDWLNDGMPENAIDEVIRILTVCQGLSNEIIARCNASAGK